MLSRTHVQFVSIGDCRDKPFTLSVGSARRLGQLNERKQSAVRQIFGLTVGIPREPPKMTPVRRAAVATEFLRQPPRRQRTQLTRQLARVLQPGLKVPRRRLYN